MWYLWSRQQQQNKENIRQIYKDSGKIEHTFFFNLEEVNKYILISLTAEKIRG